MLICEGIAAIMDAMNYFINHPEIKHGEIKVCFTTDEEIGRGGVHFNLSNCAAKYAYTMDGGEIGEIETETFNADQMTITFIGKNTHPGTAKHHKMINSIKIAASFFNSLPEKLSPEATEGREGFVHCLSADGKVEKSTVRCIIRDFDESKLTEYQALLISLAQKAVDKFPGSRFEYTNEEQYRNMKNILNKYPEVEENALIALKILDIKPIQNPIRGGTDGKFYSLC